MDTYSDIIKRYHNDPIFYNFVDRLVAEKLEKYESEEPLTVLKLLLDHIDYTKHNCGINEQVGAVLPRVILERAQKVIA